MKIELNMAHLGAIMLPVIIESVTCSACAKVQSFVRGRSVMKRRDKLKAQGRAQSVPRDEMLPCKVKSGQLYLRNCIYV